MASAEESNDTEKKNGNEEKQATQSSTKSTTSKPVKVKVEIVADDEDDEEDVDVDEKCRRKDSKVILIPNGKSPPSQKRETDDGLPGDVGRVASRRSSDNAGDNGTFSGSIENEETGSDDLNHDRYSPFEGMCESSESDYFSPIQDQNGNVVLEVACGSNSALLYVNKLCQGSKGQCVLFEDRWYTPNEFQFISGRETAKDWKRSIRHRGKSLKILMGRGLLMAHPLMCECDTCRLNFASKGLRTADRRSAVSTSTTNSNGSLAMIDRSRLRRTTGPDGEGGHLNEIIDQLQHGNSNGYSNGNHHVYDNGRKRSLGVDNVSPTGSSPSSSMQCGLALVKRPRSVSPRDDDIYDEQQRKIFEAANSPEPQNIENLRRSLNMSSSRSNSPSSGDRNSPSGGLHHSFYGSHGTGRNAPTVMVAASVNSNNTTPVTNGAGPADLSRNSSASPQSAENVRPTRLMISQPPQMMVKHQTKSRKQTAPQHLDVGNHGDEAHPQRSAHIVLSNYSGQQYKANAAVRPRYQSTPVYNHRSTINSSTNHHATGSSGELNLSTNGGSRRTHSSTLTPVTRGQSQRAPPGTPLKMIELTRPEIVPSSSSGYSSRPSSTHSSSNTGEEGRSHTPLLSSIGNTDAVFLPADLTSWSISDVLHFVQSLKGCEDYCPVFREQAIDGEILPVLTEDHLLHNMGLKLGPALKIRLHVARRLGFTLDGQYCNTIAPAPTPHTPQLPPPSLTPQESTGTPAPPGPSTPGTASTKPASEVFTEDD